MPTVKYKITKNDLKSCWNFSVEYFLDPKKDVYDRVAYKKRGLGGIADSFLQKLLEIGVCKIIQKNGSNIIPQTDFEIHVVGEKQVDNRTEPDIIRVFRKDYSQQDGKNLKNLINSRKKNLKKLNEELEKLKKKRKDVKHIKDCKSKSEEVTARAEKIKQTSKIKIKETEISKTKSQIQLEVEKLGEWKKNTDPKIYVEIKNTAEKDAWIGPKLAEVASITSRSKFKKSDIYYVYCRIVDNGKWDSDEEKNAGRRSDPLGVFLKSNLKNSNLKKFHNINNLEVEIQNVMTVKDIQSPKNGTKFPRGTIIPNPNVITIPGQRFDALGYEDKIPFSEKTIKEYISIKKYTIEKLQNSMLPKETSTQGRAYNSRTEKWENTGWASYPSALGDFTVKGSIDLYRDESAGTRRFWIESLGDVTILNSVIGDTKLKKGDIRCYQIRKQGRIESKSVDDIWISKYNEKLMAQFPPSRISEISNKI